MLKKLLFFNFLFLSISIIAQEQEATLHFRDGTTILGYGDIINEKDPGAFEKRVLVLFKITKDDKAEEWDGELVDRIVFHGYQSSETLQFVHTPENKRSKYKLLRLITEGEVSLYADIDDYFSITPQTSYTTTPLRMSYNFVNGRPSKTRVTGGEIKAVNGQLWNSDSGDKYYLRRKNEEKFFNFTGGKKKIAAYFNNCAGIAKMLDADNFDINTLEDIVAYYNDLCGAETEDIDEVSKD